MILVNKCNAIYDASVLISAMRWFCDGKINGYRSVYLHAKYPSVTLRGHKVHIHRVIAAYKNGDIPVGKIIHHRNGNRLDARWCNLKIMTQGEHSKFHNKGVKKPDGFSDKVIANNRKRKGIKHKKVYDIPIDELGRLFKEGATIADACEYYGCTYPVVRLRIDENPKLGQVINYAKNHKGK